MLSLFLLLNTNKVILVVHGLSVTSNFIVADCLEPFCIWLPKAVIAVESAVK